MVDNVGDLEKNIIMVLENSPGLSDRELTEIIRGHGASPQYINENCRKMHDRHIIIRKKRKDRLIGNWLNTDVETCRFIDRTGLKKNNEEIPEKKIKQALESYLTSRGWETRIAWGLTHGIDIEARNGAKRWIIEVKGSEPISTLTAGSFITVLGEILQRMDDLDCKYSIALPDSLELRRLWTRLPLLAKNRTGITALFINNQGLVSEM